LFRANWAQNIVAGGENASRKIVTVIKLQFIHMMRFGLLLLLPFFVINSCGSLKNTNSKDKSELTINLPPNVGSNKYSKKRN
jgi:hypothetical protein